MLRGADQLMLMERETTQPMRLEELTVHVRPPAEESHHLSSNGEKSIPPVSEEPGAPSSN
jgi:hypothetical protein